MKTLKQIGSRNYIVENDKKLKMIPKDYVDIPVEDIISCMDFDSKITLNNSERFNLEVIIYENTLENEEKYVHELINGSKPEKALFVNVNMANPRTELQYSNGVRLKCPKKIYDLAETKETVFSNY